MALSVTEGDESSFTPPQPMYTTQAAHRTPNVRTAGAFAASSLLPEHGGGPAKQRRASADFFDIIGTGDAEERFALNFPRQRVLPTRRTAIVRYWRRQ